MGLSSFYLNNFGAATGKGMENLLTENVTNLLTEKRRVISSTLKLNRVSSNFYPSDLGKIWKRCSPCGDF